MSYKLVKPINHETFPADNCTGSPCICGPEIPVTAVLMRGPDGVNDNYWQMLVSSGVAVITK